MPELTFYTKYSYGLLHMAEQKQGDQLEPTYNSVDMECNPEDLPEAMNDREGWRERVRDICADGTTRWWDYEMVPSIAMYN